MKKLLLLTIIALCFQLTVNSQESEKKETSLEYFKKKRKEKLMEDYAFIRSTCHIDTDKVDEIDGIEKKITSNYSLTEPSFRESSLNVTIMKLGESKYLKISTNKEMGCVIPYSNNRSKVVFKLKNGINVNFFHSGKENCSNYALIGKLTESDIKKLKSSPIKMVRMYDIEHYIDIYTILYKDFFIEKIDCVNK